MLIDLPVKTILFTTLLALLTSSTIAQEEQSIKFTLSIQKSINQPKSAIKFERTDNNIKWFDDSNISTHSDLTYGLIIPLKKIELNYRRHTVQGAHEGEALKEVCIFALCSWASSSLISGLENNEEIHYQMDNNELWIEKPLHIKSLSSITISPLIGINIIPVKFIINNSDDQETKNATLPIPFWGARLEKQLSNSIKITSEFHHLNYDHTDWGVLYQNYQVGIERHLTKNMDISVGYSDYHLNTKYNKNSKDTEFDLSLKTPFIKISTHF